MTAREWLEVITFTAGMLMLVGTYAYGEAWEHARRRARQLRREAFAARHPTTFTVNPDCGIRAGDVLRVDHPDPRPWWRRLLDRLLRRPHPHDFVVTGVAGSVLTVEPPK